MTLVCCSRSSIASYVVILLSCGCFFTCSSAIGFCALRLLSTWIIIFGVISVATLCAVASFIAVAFIVESAGWNSIALTITLGLRACPCLISSCCLTIAAWPFTGTTEPTYPNTHRSSPTVPKSSLVYVSVFGYKKYRIVQFLYVNLLFVHILARFTHSQILLVEFLLNLPHFNQFLFIQTNQYLWVLSTVIGWRYRTRLNFLVPLRTFISATLFTFTCGLNYHDRYIFSRWVTWFGSPLTWGSLGLFTFIADNCWAVISFRWVFIFMQLERATLFRGCRPWVFWVRGFFLSSICTMWLFGGVLG